MNDTQYEQEMCNCAVDNAYWRGYKDGAKDTQMINTSWKDEGYEQGLADAWECVKKIYSLTLAQKKEIFGHELLNEIMEIYSPSESITRIQQYKELEKQNEIDETPILGRCKDCKYFKYDVVTQVNGIRYITGHETCVRWGDGCKSNENGYCHLFTKKKVEE